MKRPQPVIVPFPPSSRRTSKTPSTLAATLSHEFHFDVFVEGFGGKAERALREDWAGSVWVHVDYGNVEAWLRKIVRERERGVTVVALMPARTSTSYFHDYVLGQANEVRFVRGRLVMDGTKKQSPYSSLIAIYHGMADEGQVLTSFTDDRNEFV